MTQEEKQLLLKDLCARLPYGIKVCYRISDKDNPIIETLSGHMLDYFNENSIVEVKPYLRPMSSMTEEEEKEFIRFISKSMHRFVCEETKRAHWFNAWEEEDWLDEHHFDYRGLIPMGLALEAPKDMYNTKTE